LEHSISSVIAIKNTEKVNLASAQGAIHVDREYDVFEKFPDGSHIWRAFVKGLIEARARVVELSETSMNEIYAIHTPTKEIVATSPPKCSE
jgi:hypothetical protein